MTDRTPTGDLRERLADALREAAYVCPGDKCPHDEDTCGVGEPIVLAAGTYIDGEPEGALIDGEVTAIADAVLPVVEDYLADAVRHRDQAERRAALLREQVRTEHVRAERAEAAVQRVRDLAASLHDGVLVRRFLTALDQPEETPDA